MAEEKPPVVDPLKEVDQALRVAKAEWLCFEFPYFVPMLRDTDGNLKIIVGRIRTDQGTGFCLSAYSSLKARDRSTLWAAGGRVEEIIFVKVASVAPAYCYWHNALTKFFRAVPELTREHVHDLSVLFDHEDGKPWPHPICAYCYVLELEKACAEEGIRVRPQNQEGDSSNDLDNTTSDSLETDVE